MAKPLPSQSSQSSGAGVRPSAGRAIDLVHLSRQTLGDRGLEAEVLVLMRRQIAAFTGRLALAEEDELRHIAHALKGAARSVGAFPLATAAEAVEVQSQDATTLSALEAEMARTDAFIAELVS